MVFVVDKFHSAQTIINLFNWFLCFGSWFCLKEGRKCQPDFIAFYLPKLLQQNNFVYRKQLWQAQVLHCFDGSMKFCLFSKDFLQLEILLNLLGTAFASSHTLLAFTDGIESMLMYPFYKALFFTMGVYTGLDPEWFTPT